ncbi:MAG: ankyrin repeat domain-containing protein [Taibaiella sp.]|jgi:ankyrin repeat protein
MPLELTFRNKQTQVFNSAQEALWYCLENNYHENIPTVIQAMSGTEYQENRNRALKYAAERNNAEAVKIICSYNNFTPDDDTAKLILNATVKNEIEIAIDILYALGDQKIDLEKEKFEGKNMLRIAVEKQSINLKLIKLLIKNGADINQPLVRNEEITTPLSHIVSLNNTDLLDIFTNPKYFKVNENTGRAILQAAESNNLHPAQKIFFAAKTINATINFHKWHVKRKTSLMHAISHNNDDFVDFLMNQDARANDKIGTNDPTALYIAVCEGYINLVTIICTSANFVAPGDIGLHILESVKLNLIIITRQLLQARKSHELSLDFYTFADKTALRIAVENKNYPLVTLLVSHGANPNIVRINDNESPLSYAKKHDHNAYVAICNSYKFTTPTNESTSKNKKRPITDTLQKAYVSDKDDDDALSKKIKL